MLYLLGKKESFELYGTDFSTPDGTAVRDYIHVTDLASAHVLALKQLLDTQESNVFNLGTTKGYSVLEVIRAVEAETGQKVNYKPKPRRRGDVPILLASKEKAERVLGWELNYSGLETIIETAWRWHKRLPE
jgi:UDP-glucose 4-epimerase